MDDEALRFKVAATVLDASGGVDQRASEEDTHTVHKQGLSPTAGAAVLCFVAALVALAVVIAKHRDHAAQTKPSEQTPEQCKMLACKFFLTGNCNAGKDCKYSHAQSDIDRLKQQQKASAKHKALHQFSAAKHDLKQF